MTHVISHRRRPKYLWPCILLWGLATAVERRVGIFPVLVLGLVLATLGWLLIASLLGAVIGIPLLVLGLFLFARGIC